MIYNYWWDIQKISNNRYNNINWFHIWLVDRKMFLVWNNQIAPEWIEEVNMFYDNYSIHCNPWDIILSFLTTDIKFKEEVQDKILNFILSKNDWYKKIHNAIIEKWVKYDSFYKIIHYFLNENILNIANNHKTIFNTIHYFYGKKVISFSSNENSFALYIAAWEHTNKKYDNWKWKINISINELIDFIKNEFNQKEDNNIPSTKKPKVPKWNKCISCITWERFI